MKLAEILTRDLLDRLRHAAVGESVGMKAVDQAVEHRARDEVGVLEADAEVLNRLLALALDLFGREGRPADDLGEHVHADVEAVFHHENGRRRHVAARPGVERAANRVDGIRNLAGAARGRALVQQRRDERGGAALARRIVAAAGADEQPHRDFGLLVVHHHDHLHAVRQRPELVRRESSPASTAGAAGGFSDGQLVTCAPADRAQARGERKDRSEERASQHQRMPFGRIFSTSRLSGVKYVFATRCRSDTFMFVKISTSPSAVVTSS